MKKIAPPTPPLFTILKFQNIDSVQTTPSFNAISIFFSVFSRDSDLTTSIVLDGCGYVKSQVWLCSKRCGYVKVGVVMLKKVWLCCHQNLNTPFRS